MLVCKKCVAMKKIDGLKKYFVLLNEHDLALCKSKMLELDVRNIDVVSNTSKVLRYLVRLGIIASGLSLSQEIRDVLRKE